MKFLYVLSLAAGIAIAAVIYFVKFDDLSEEELVNASLTWYLPVIFGLYGLLAMRVQETARARDGEKPNVFQILFSADSPALLVFIVIVAIFSGLLGAFFFLVPLALFKPESSGYHIRVAAAASLSWVLALFLFFAVIWPSL